MATFNKFISEYLKKENKTSKPKPSKRGRPKASSNPPLNKNKQEKGDK